MYTLFVSGEASLLCFLELSSLADVNYNDIGQQMNRSTLNLNCCQFCTNKRTDKSKILCEMQSTRNVFGREEEGKEKEKKLPWENAL